MARYERLRRSRDLDRVFQQGMWRRAEGVSAGAFPRDDDGPARVAFIAGRAVGTAVRRNRARRRLREALRTMPVVLRPGKDVVLAARHDTPELPFVELQAAVGRLLMRLGCVEPDGESTESGP